MIAAQLIFYLSSGGRWGKQKEYSTQSTKNVCWHVARWSSSVLHPKLKVLFVRKHIFQSKSQLVKMYNLGWRPTHPAIPKHQFQFLRVFEISHFYKISHISFTLRVYDRTFMSEGGGGAAGITDDKAAKHMTAVHDCVSTFVSVTLFIFYFKETSGQFPVVILATKTGNLRQNMMSS